jgi:hypothetical protein
MTLTQSWSQLKLSRVELQLATCFQSQCEVDFESTSPTYTVTFSSLHPPLPLLHSCLLSPPCCRFPLLCFPLPSCSHFLSLTPDALDSYPPSLALTFVPSPTDHILLLYFPSSPSPLPSPALTAATTAHGPTTPTLVCDSPSPSPFPPKFLTSVLVLAEPPISWTQTQPPYGHFILLSPLTPSSHLPSLTPVPLVAPHPRLTCPCPPITSPSS